MPTASFTRTLAKYLPTIESRRKFKRQCLKQKNILQENDSIQIGCKIQKLYDFCTSRNYVQINIFIGNKTSRSIQKYSVEFKGTPNLQVFLQQKGQRTVNQNTQAKQRIVIQWLPQNTTYTSQLFLTISFTSPILTLKDTAIPLSLWSFYNFPLNMQHLLTPSITTTQLTQLIKQKYQLIQQQVIDMNTAMFKKGVGVKQMEKMLERLVRIDVISEVDEKCAFAGVFTVKSLLEEVFIMVEVSNQLVEQPRMTVTLAGNQYSYFQAVFDNLQFLFGK